MKHSRRRLDLTGQRFGKLTVLAPAENVGRLTAWRCRCDCGQETVAVTKRLRDGHRTSCGCDKEFFGESPAEIGRASLTYVDGTCVEMLRAKTVRCNNTSGVPGVDWLAKKQRWRASI
ncbi:MAG: transcriptional regulator, partial [Oscillospiraceae bacterium]|nr:transcriptional regulator [Oscillospiraceae bacterium]